MSNSLLKKECSARQVCGIRKDRGRFSSRLTTPVEQSTFLMHRDSRGEEGCCYGDYLFRPYRVRDDSPPLGRVWRPGGDRKSNSHDAILKLVEYKQWPRGQSLYPPGRPANASARGTGGLELLAVDVDLDDAEKQRAAELLEALERIKRLLKNER